MGFSKLIFSESTVGEGIKIAATATAGTLIHATGVSASIRDEVYLFFINSDSVARVVSVEYAGVTDPDDLIEVSIPPNAAPLCVIPGWVITGTGAAATNVRAFCAAAANVLVAYGYVHRIS